jgi:hypothetical protein
LSSVILENKDAIYKSNPHTAEELQQEISPGATSVSEETPAAVVRNFRRPLQMVLAADGATLKTFLRDF